MHSHASLLFSSRIQLEELKAIENPGFFGKEEKTWIQLEELKVHRERFHQQRRVKTGIQLEELKDIGLVGELFQH